MKTHSLKPSPHSTFNVRCAKFTLALTTPPAARASPLRFPLSVFCFLFFLTHASAATRYVWQGSPSPGAPYDTWATAAHDIQTAVDAAVAGEEIVVTNGVYATGGRAVGTNVLVNRVAADKPVTLHSVNGPLVTTIEGSQMRDEYGAVTSGVRCVYLAGDADLSGFTLTNGCAQSGGGVYCQSATVVVSNCLLVGNSAELGWDPRCGGGAYSGTLHNCSLTGNWAESGGGAYGSLLDNCTLTGNAAWEGGGACEGTLNHCMLTDNRTTSPFGAGGGTCRATLNNCVLTGNSAVEGGAAFGGMLSGSTLTGNWASSGGGAYGSLLNSCVLAGNSAFCGGGASEGTVNNCTLTGNSASRGGGTYGGTLSNCIVYFNKAMIADDNYSGSTVNHCCTTPMPAVGAGNITVDPQLASLSHLSANSPCLGAGSAAPASETDIDGEAWATPPSIGCDEYRAGAVTGSLSVGIAAACTNVVPGCAVGFTALIEGRTAASVWDFGDGTTLSNQPYATHAWTALGDSAVVLRAYNESYPGGVSATVIVHAVEQQVHYVAVDSANPLPPYTSWATAAKNIQDAVDAAAAGGTVVVSNGVYATGGRARLGKATNRVTVDKPLHVRSVNGPLLTTIEGCPMRDQYGTVTNGVRCVYLASLASLSGFTLTNGTRLEGWSGTLFDTSGGGLRCESASAIVSNCVLLGNSASSGGGAYGGTLYNCTLAGNWTDEFARPSSGGGAYGATLSNCVLTGNSAAGANCLFGLDLSFGGGVCECVLYNSALSGNQAVEGGGAFACTLYNCTLTGNSALSYSQGYYYEGGAARECTLFNCTVAGNSANHGGGVYQCTLFNSVLADNRKRWYLSPDNYYASSLNYCCTTPLPTNGIGNIDAEPLFVDYASGNLHLQPDSPCIDAGTNLTGLIATDILGLPRPMDGDGDGLARFDMGAYEFNPYRFEPTLQVSARGFLFTVCGEPGRSVRIERSDDLVNWELAGQVPIPACGQTLIDPAATTEPHLFYRAMRVP